MMLNHDPWLDYSASQPKTSPSISSIGATSGMIVGNDRFREEIEALTGRRVKEKKRGRPFGWRKPKI